MRTLTKILSVSLFIGWLSGCDESTTKTVTNNINSQTVSVLAGKMTFNVPKKLIDQRGNLENQTNNMLVYADTSSGQSAIVIVSDSNDESTQTMIDELEKQQIARNEYIKTIKRTVFNLGQYSLQRLDTLSRAKDRQIYSSIVLVKIDGKLVTLQINMLGDDPQTAQQTVEQIINSIQIAAN